MVVAPILAIMSYFATDFLVSEKPHIAKDGAIYKMRLASNCRWESGKCTLDNEDINIDIIGQWTNQMLIINVSSNILLNNIKVSFNANDEKQTTPKDMKINKNDNSKWNISLSQKNKSNMLNFAFIVNRSIFLAQVPTVFIK